MFKATEIGIEKIKFNLFKFLILDLNLVLDSIDFYSLPYNDFFNTCIAKYGHNHFEQSCENQVKLRADNYYDFVNFIQSDYDHTVI